MTFSARFRLMLSMSGLAIALGATISCGSSSSASASPTPVIAPSAAFTFAPSAPFPGQSVTFSDGSTGSPTAWSWDFGDGTEAATAQNPTHTYAAAGSYSVTLKVTNAGGSSSMVHVVAVSAPASAPTALFTFSPSAPVTGQAVAFTDASTGTPTSWAWNFGDGSAVSTVQSPAHVFIAAGAYTVTLTASNGTGSSAPVQHAVSVIAAGTALAAEFTLTPSTANTGQTVSFTDATVNSPTAWSWNFGDGFAAASTSSAQNPTHTYTAAGTYTVTLKASNATASSLANHTVTITTPGIAAAAAFVFAPTLPVTGQATAFRDTSTGNPTAWNWTFGDGGTSTVQNPSHVYSGAGTFTVGLSTTTASGSTSVSHAVTVVPANSASTFDGNIVLGSPTDTSIKANVFSADQSGSVYLAYGTASGSYGTSTSTVSLQAATPLELALNGLAPNTLYYYKLYFRATGQTSTTSTSEYTFHSARPAGNTFTFCLQGDSHPERAGTGPTAEFNSDLYNLTLATAAADQPDFYITMGDDFSIDQLVPATIDNAQVVERYLIQRPYLGLIGRSAPVFLVNGNHEQAARYLLDGTPNNPAVWAQNARNTHYSEPATDGFYSANSELVPNIGLLRNYYAWTWGDALFVVIDPYWESPTCVDNPFFGGSKRSNLWDITHGDAQYQWLKATLEQSHAKYKFVFAHHVMGTQRGGVEVATTYEWGGNDANTTSYSFPVNRPAWSTPIHQLMKNNGVTIFFQGHDHLWVKQQLDGVVYQELPEPADPNYLQTNASAYSSAGSVIYPNTGYTRVTVSPTAGVKVDYVHTCLPADAASGKSTSGLAYTYSIPPPVALAGVAPAKADSTGQDMPSPQSPKK